MALRLPSALRRSLAARVFLITITIFTIGSGVIGTVIFGQIEDRIIDERIDSSIGEARSTIAAAEFRFALVQSLDLEKLSPEFIESTFNEVMALAIAPSATVSAREIALIKSPETTIAQCGSGISACHNLLAMEIAGLPGAALYPGSWSEWSADPSRPVATGTA